jgi:hypothetical protein
MDRLLQAGKIAKIDGGLKLDSKTADQARAVRQLNDENWAKLKEKLDRILTGELGRKAESVDSSPVLGLVGAALCAGSSPASDALSPTEDPSGVTQHFQRRSDELHASLQEMGFGDTAQRSKVVEELIRAASQSSVGKALVAAEMFNFVSGLDASKLGIALGAQSGLPGVVLDASVAIPMLLSLLYEPAKNRFFLASAHAYRQAKAHRVELSLPKDYLEEAATHLIAAARDYAPVVDLDDQLAGSTNAYVSHYVDLRRRGKVDNFNTYLVGLGARPHIIRLDFRAARQVLMNTLGTAFRRYGIQPIFEERPNEAVRAAAERELAYVTQELQRERAQITARHDAKVIAHLQGSARDPKRTGLLCTWDRLLIIIQRRLQASWDALNPSILGDLLSLASAESRGVTLISPITLAMALHEAEVDRGAAIWDWLIAHEKSKFHDARYRQSAMKFKEEYMQSADDTRPSRLARAWEEWKARYLNE